MASPLNKYTTIEQRGVVQFLWAKNMEAKDIHKEMLPMWTFVCAPDDGWWYHPKHVEQFPDINKLRNVASCWI
jgi:hypothetical protein